MTSMSRDPRGASLTVQLATAALRDLLWSEAAEIPMADPSEWRVDHLCRVMRYEDFGDAASAFGWIFSFVDPDSHEAPDALAAVNYSSPR